MSEAVDKRYELKVTPTQVLLRVAAPTDGKKANLSDIQKELKTRDIAYRHDNLFEIYKRASNDFEILAKREAEHYEVFVDVQKDGMQATMTITPPDRGDERLDPAKVKLALQHAHIVKGLLYEEVQRAIRERIENEPVVIAQGKPAVPGEDGEIDFVFDQQPSAPDATAEEVNFKELGLIKNVDEGDVIAKFKPPTPGEPGYTVLGRELKAKQGKVARVKLGRNVTMSEDGKELRAASGGYVLYSGDRIAVENVYQVHHVNGATGNIHFTGVVLVQGNVEDNFTIDAEKGIEVGGSVGKATLKTGGDVKVRGGVIGALIESQRNVTAKFFSESNVQAGENVTADDYILHSQIQAGKTVRVTKTPTGFINGGTTRAGDMVVSPNIGSDVAEERTMIEAGMRPNLRMQFDTLALKLEKNELTFEKLRKNLLVLQHQRRAQKKPDPQKSEAFEKLIDAAQQVRQQLLEDVQRYRTLSGELGESDVERGYVLVQNTVFPGVTVQIRRQTFLVKDALMGSGFRLMHGELKVQDFAEVSRLYRAQHGKSPT